MHTAADSGPQLAPGHTAKDDEFSAWMTARRPALLRTAYLLTGDHHGAEDLVQKALVKIYLAWDKVHRREALDSYARRVLVNENASLWRRAWKRREVSTERLPDDAAAHDDYDEGRTAELWTHVGDLPGKQRAVIVLRYYEELSEAETAAVLGISTGTVKSQASRALAKLRRAAGERPGLEGER